MRLPEPWLSDIQKWAELNGNIQEVWLFGSRADDNAVPVKDDVDLAIVLMPPIVRSGRTSHDWAGGNYQKFGDEWRRELVAIVGRHVDLAIYDAALMAGAVPLWRRAD
jgi:predicted nucleotidyltransferase